MKLHRYYFALILVAVLCLCASSWRRTEATAQAPTGARTREDAYRANNLGVALLEQFKHKEGAEQFRRALSLDPKLTLARINLAIALYNVPDAVASQKEAEAAAAAAPDAPQPHYILGLIARQQSRVEDAVAAFRRVLKIDPRDTGANVQLGQLYSQERKYPEAVAALRAALAEEPYNGTALYNLGTALLRSGQREEGQRLMQQFQLLRQSGAATIIGQNYMEQGRYAEAVTSTGAEPDLVDRRVPDVSFNDATANTLPTTGKAPEEGTAAPASVGKPFVWKWESERGAAGALAESLGSGATLFDFDGDGDLDLFEVSGATQRLYRNDGGKFADISSQSGAFAKEAGDIGISAVAGDFDNDEKPDLFVLRYGASGLYHNDGGGRFTEVTAGAKIPSYPYLSVSVTFVDCDHDGDLDIFIAGLADLSKVKATSAPVQDAPPGQGGNGAFGFLRALPAAPSLLLRNNGDGTFTDQTAAAKLSGSVGHALAVVPTDYDNRRDVDLLVVNFDSAPALWRNLRDGTFRNVSAEVGLDLKNTSLMSVAAGDINKDSFIDFYFGRADAPGDFALSDGKGRFQIKPAPTSPSGASASGQNAAQILDYDNDGLLDLLTLSASGAGLNISRNTGDGWTDVSDKASRGLFAPGAGPSLLSRALASGDMDGDGDTDLILRATGGGLKFARNDGGNLNRSLRVQLAGKVSNRSGVGAKIEMRAGSLQQKLETYSASPAPAPADLAFGLGQRESADAVRILWPSGVVQAETQSASGPQAVARVKPVTLKIMELDRKPSSCPYLYAWNGERFEFITDFMGGGEMGGWVAPGVFNTPDPDEYVRIPGDRLKPLDGRYELRVTNELEEVLFADRFQLVAVAHPAGVEVYPEEGLRDAPPPFKLYTVKDARPPVAAVDEHGHDVLARIAQLDRQYPDDFKLKSIRGYSEEHALTLDLGALDAGKRALLLLTGWTDYAFSSDNVAASQSNLAMQPPALQVKDSAGKWRTVVENIGIPVGRPQTLVVDLTGKFLSASREVRIVTNMRVYWDQILLDVSGGDFPLRLTRLDPLAARLRWRGFSAEVTPDGREPFSYDYTRISLASPWKAFPGRYTREGDVRELLTSADDMFVVSRTGDELSLSFDASVLPALPAGWTRTFLLYADGFSKEMNIHSASPDMLAPLPFHGMKSYPYKEPEAYPLTPARADYIRRYNTRVVAKPLTQLATGDAYSQSRP